MASIDAGHLRADLERVRSHLSSWAGIVYRSTTPQYATSRDLLSGDGSRLMGGRWNPIGLSAVYGSLDPETALAETLAAYRRYSIPIQSAMPRVFVAIEVEIKSCLDLTNASMRRRLKLTRKELIEVDWKASQKSLTQCIGKLCHEVGIQGLLVPSACRLERGRLSRCS